MGNKEIFEIIENLENDVDTFSNKNDSTLKSCMSHLQDILKVIDKIGESWSNSWIGYHADLYYGDFQHPPIHARFDSELGFMFGPQNGWNEKTCGDVTNFINKNYSGVSLKKIKESLIKIEKDSLHTKVCSELSFIRNFDNFDKEISILNEIEEIKWKFSPADIIQAKRPNNYITRDSSAMSQGLRVAPHIRFESIVLSFLSMIKSIKKFVKLVRRLLKQIKIRLSVQKLDNKSYSQFKIKNHKERKSQIYIALGLLISSVIATNVIKSYFSSYEIVFFYITIILAITIVLLVIYYFYLYISDK